MKNKRVLCLLLVSIFGLVGCNNSNIPSSSESSSETTSSVVSSTSQEVNKEEYYALPDGYENLSDDMSIGDDLIDIAIDKQFLTGSDHTISFSFVNLYSETSEVYSSNEKVFTIEKIDENTYTLHALHDGEAFITIKDKRGLIRYRHVVYVRDAMTLDQMLDYLPEVEYWQSYAGYGDSFKLTFLYDNQVGVSGALSNSSFEPYTATFKLKEENEEEFRFIFTDENSSNSAAGLTGFNISKCGDIMYLQDANGTTALMFPNTRKF